MPISPDMVLDRLADIPHRGATTEEEVEARETMAALLEGVPGVEAFDEGFFTPKTYLRFFWSVAITIVLAIWLQPLAPLPMALLALGAFGSLVWFLDWRSMPLVWILARGLTANLVARLTPERAAERGIGDQSPLIILMAHLDSAPAAYAYRSGQVEKFKFSFFGAIAAMGVAPWVLFIQMGTGAVPVELNLLMTVLVLTPAVISSIDYWQHGFTPGGNDNATGVAAVTAAASRLWEDRTLNAEVRLVLTSAEEAGMLGAQVYYRRHREELQERRAMIINVDSVGAGNLYYVSHTGAITTTIYDNKMTKAAKSIGLSAHGHHVGDFDSIWFQRGGLDVVTLAAYDQKGLMPYIHTPEDRIDVLDRALVGKAADKTEEIVRHLLGQAVNVKPVGKRGHYV